MMPGMHTAWRTHRMWCSAAVRSCALHEQTPWNRYLHEPRGGLTNLSDMYTATMVHAPHMVLSDTLSSSGQAQCTLRGLSHSTYHFIAVPSNFMSAMRRSKSAV